ncbi:MAG: allantoinase AllB [Chloroflexi bacterium]|nr:allantoinase AllB [Chloroflexota bacterium]
MSTLLVAGGLVVDEHTLAPRDILVDDGRIDAVVTPGTAPPADDVLDATGLHVLPGVVDAHVHFNEPGRTDWEGFHTGTTAAAAGGVTTVCDMPLNSHPPTLDARALAIKQSAVQRSALIDYALWGGVVPGSIHHLADLQRSGVIGVKGFMCDSGLAEYPPLDEFSLLETMQLCADLGLLLALHAEDATATGRGADLMRAAGRRAAVDWALSRPGDTEVKAVERALDGVAATGARVHFVHISTASAARAIANARASGADVTCETCPHYLVLDQSDLERLGGFGKCAPPLRPREVVEDLWGALLDGSIDLIASDHSPCPPDMKHTPDIWSAWGGLAGVQTMLPVLLDEAVHVRGVPLRALVRLLCAAPARRLGLFPRKGSLQPGADADFTLVDLDRTWTVDERDLRTRWPLNPFTGRVLHGAVVATVVRGTVVSREGRPLVACGYGLRVCP